MQKTCEITCPCSRDTGHARRRRSRRRSRKIRPDRLSHRSISGLSGRTRPIDLSRPRRRTHGTSRTTRHARHDHGTGTVQRRNVLISRSGNIRFTAPTSDYDSCEWTRRMDRLVCVCVLFAVDNEQDNMVITCICTV